MTAKELHLLIQGQIEYDYANLRSALSYFKKQGFIRYTGNEFPHVYALTSKGEYHAEHPDIHIQKFNAWKQRLIEASLKDNRNVQIAVENALREAMLSGEFGSVTQIVDKMTGGSLTQSLNESAAKDEKIAELEAKIIELSEKQEEEKCRVVEKADQKKRRDAETKKRIADRRNFAEWYLYNRQGFVDAEFFRLWGVVAPYWIKTNGAPVIEIIAHTNKEHERGHSIRPLNDMEIKMEGMRIKSRDIRIVEKLTIGGKTMRNAVLSW